MIDHRLHRKRNQLSRVILIFLLAVVGGVSIVHAQNSDLTLSEGVVVDPSQNVVYALDSAANLMALDLSSGTEKWTVAEAYKPLLVVGGRLLCQSANFDTLNQFDLVELDVSTGRQQGSGYSSLLPQAVAVNQPDQRKSVFNVQAQIVNDQPYLAWYYRQIPRRGLFEAQEETQENSGFLQINPSAHTMDTLSAASLSLPQRSIIKPRSSVEFEGQEFYASDRTHYLRSRKVADDLTFNSYQWEIFRTSDDQRIGVLNDYRSFAPFYVYQGVIIYTVGPYTVNQEGKMVTQPLALRGFDLTSNLQAWLVTVLDPTYRGPVPP